MPEYRLERSVYVVGYSQEEIGRGDCEDIEACLKRALETVPEDAKAILVDMEGVRYLKSSGLGALLTLCERLKPRGLKLAVCRVPSFGRNLFKIAGLDQFLQVYGTAEEGLSALGAASKPS